MARKMLEAQRARSYAMGQCDETLWGRDEAMLRACAESQKAYQEIRQLTDFYNNRMAGGKWKYSMCYNPRDLYVFFPPILPVWQTDAEVDSIRKVSDVMHPLKDGTEKDSWYLAKDACDYNRATSRSMQPNAGRTGGSSGVSTGLFIWKQNHRHTSNALPWMHVPMVHYAPMFIWLT